MSTHEELTIEEKADIVAESTIQANSKLNAAPGRDQLKEDLSEKLVDSHQQGKLDLDKFVERERSKSMNSDIEDGRSR
jgi:hypothetical protein